MSTFAVSMVSAGSQRNSRGECAQVNLQMIHTALASTSKHWFRRSLKRRLLAWRAEAARSVSIADSVCSSAASRLLRNCLDE